MPDLREYTMVITEGQVVTYRSFGDSSPSVPLVVRQIMLNDLTDPLNPVKAAYDWFVTGKYTTDMEPLDGSNDIDGNPRPSLKFYEYSAEEAGVPTGFANVYIDGNSTTANGIPLLACAADHTAALLIRGVPRTKEVLLSCTIVFTRPDGRTVIFTFKEAIE